MRPGFFWCKGNRAGVWHGMWMRSKWGKRRERENEGEIEACCFWSQKVVERGRRGDRGKRAVHTDGAAGCQVTCHNRSGHHVSGAEYDDAGKTEYEGIRQKSVPTIERRGARDIIRGCHNRDKGTAESERLRDPKFIFSYPKNERLIFLNGRMVRRKKSRP